MVERMICNFFFWTCDGVQIHIPREGGQHCLHQGRVQVVCWPLFLSTAGSAVSDQGTPPFFHIVSWCCVRWPVGPCLLPHKFMKNWHSYGGGEGDREDARIPPQKVDFLKHRNSCWKPLNQILVFFLRKERFLEDFQCQDVCYICALVRDKWAEVHNYDALISASNSW